MLNYFQAVNHLVAAGKLNDLQYLQPPKPEYFNWVEDVFYPMNVEKRGTADALIWKYKSNIEVFSFTNMYQRCNQLVNLLRKNQIKEKDTLYTMLPLVPENWISFLATIKGGFIIMPTATNLVSQDLIYRFQTIPRM